MCGINGIIYKMDKVWMLSFLYFISVSCIWFISVNGACQSGRWGNSCENTCPVNCYNGSQCSSNPSWCSCDQTSGKCALCEQGKFGDKCDVDCSSVCSAGCSQVSGMCYSAFCRNCNGGLLSCKMNVTWKCESCNLGKWGADCSKKCSDNNCSIACNQDTGACVPSVCDNCLNGLNSCNVAAGTCSACKPGYFGTGCTLTCSSSCSSLGCDQSKGQCFPAFCKNCHGGATQCNLKNYRCSSTCVSGFYGSQCDQTCAQFISVSNCKTCQEVAGSQQCAECESGYYLSTAKCIACNINCDSGSCNGVTGKCITGCKSGWYGDRCDVACPSRCLSDKCDRITAVCTGGCDVGYYGVKCETSCPEHCKNNVCDKGNAACIQGCDSGYYEVMCDKNCGKCDNTVCDQSTGLCSGSCLNGYYNDSCLAICPSKCFNNICTKSSGKCVSCVSGYYGDTCGSTCEHCVGGCKQADGKCLGSCEHSYFGDLCTFRCSDRCSPRICNKTTGECSGQCVNDQYHGQTCENVCGNNCLLRKCFKDNGYCKTGCENGYYGNHCTLVCGVNCKDKKCDRQTAECSIGCTQGFYGKYCNSSCSVGCVGGICNSNTGDCTNDCNAGFHGSKCDLTCSSNCKDNICNITSGACSTGCDDGYFGTLCDKKCPTNCKNNRCSRSIGTCHEGCKTSFYGARCDHNCPTSCLSGICDQGTNLCTSGCINGKYGVICDINCGRCNNVACNQNNGECSGDCVDGFHGSGCKQSCSSRCAEGKCVKNTGACIGACINRYYGNLCNNVCDKCSTKCEKATGNCVGACKVGYYGDRCTLSCSSKCTGSLCDKTNGKCSGSCIAGYYGEYCSIPCQSGCSSGTCVKGTGVCIGECKSGLYGEYCNETCVDVTSQSQCLTCQKSGGNYICTLCSSGYYAETVCKPCGNGCVSGNCYGNNGTCVSGCVKGRFGVKCDAACNTNCVDNECDINGVCTNGCDSGYHGQTCSLTCGKCGNLACDRATADCPGSCQNGYYGSKCLDTCSSTCSNKVCNKGDGRCTNCPLGKFGAQCTVSCEKCADGLCNQSDGKCSGLCVNKYYGDYCNISCSDFCKDKLCLKDSGNCAGLCVTGFHGDRCSKRCNSNCKDNTCDKGTGACIGECVLDYFGSFCSAKCPSQCKDSTCDKTSGICNKGCNAGFYGHYCNHTCNAGCKDNKCHQQTAICFDGCKDGQFGLYCNSTCDENCLNKKCDQTNTYCTDGCVDGWYGLACDRICDKCSDLKCNRTTGFCKSDCKIGYYGDQCVAVCPSGCSNKECIKTTGKCTRDCVIGFHGDYCDKNCSGCASGCAKSTGVCIGACKTGFYSPTCDTACSSGCIGNICDKDSGQCSGLCQDGFYGDYCNISCSTGCKNNLCIKSSGDCTGECLPGLYGSKCNNTCADVTNQLQCTQCQPSGSLFTCTECKSGFYAEGTCKPCNNGCSGGTCLGNNGTCILGCITGRYGDRCDQNCNTNCTGNTCFRNGVCSTSCKASSYGEFCDKPCGNCNDGICDRVTGYCSSDRCKVGFYGSTCTSSCSSNCVDRECRKSDGKCLSCPAGRYGPICQQLCSRCADGKCIQDTGACTGECTGKYYGIYCNLTCSDLCRDQRCQKLNGYCIGACINGYYGNKCSKECLARCSNGTCTKDSGYCLETAADAKINLIPIIIGSVVAFAILVPLLIVIIYVNCRRKRRRTEERRILVNGNGLSTSIKDMAFTYMDNISTRSSLMPQNQYVAEQISIQSPSPKMPLSSRDVDSDAGTVSLGSSAYNFPNQSSALNASLVQMLDGTQGLDVDVFPVYVQRMSTADGAYTKEHMKLPAGLQYSVIEATKPENNSKNRYRDIYPYDNSRVLLDIEGPYQNGYINASYIAGYHSPKAYIACQGPTETTVDDFWRMIWQNDCQCIVMLTNLVEGGVQKCIQYWPDVDEKYEYGGVSIECKNVEKFSNFRITELTITKDGESRTCKHAQYTTWPDKEAPKDTPSLVEFYDKVLTLPNDGPNVVHCSAGIGRTGTFIGLSYLLEQAESEGKLNVFDCVKQLRQHRPNMVQTAGQYQYLHEVLAYALKNKETTISLQEFSQYYNVLRRENHKTSKSHLERQYENLLSASSFDDNSYVSANLPENRQKNRNMKILASDDCRVYLFSQLKNCTDYINAVYLPTFYNKYAFVITEFPQNRTVVDFCRLLYQEECHTIVMMNKAFNDTKKHEQYWGGMNQTMGCGPFQLKITQREEKEGYLVQTMNFKYALEKKHKDEVPLEDKGVLQIKQFQYQGWEDGRTLPSNMTSLLDMIDDIRAWQTFSDANSKPILVHCMDGAERSGLFCVIAACVDRAYRDGNVSMVHTVNQMRCNRPQILPNIEQFRYCHEAVQHYIDYKMNSGDILL